MVLQFLVNFFIYVFFINLFVSIYSWECLILSKVEMYCFFTRYNRLILIYYNEYRFVARSLTFLLYSFVYHNV